jgi:hypothetical protein
MYVNGKMRPVKTIPGIRVVGIKRTSNLRRKDLFWFTVSSHVPYELVLET